MARFSKRFRLDRSVACLYFSILASLFINVIVVYPLLDLERIAAPFERFLLPPAVKKCVVVGMMSSVDEHRIRDWHRQQLHAWENKGRTRRTNQIRLRFAVPVKGQGDTAMNQLREESNRRRDIVFLTNAANFSTPATFGMMRSLEPILVSNEVCRTSVLIRAETKYVIHYENLLQTVGGMPTQSLYFGSILQDLPTPERSVRTAGGFSPIIFPPHAHGGFFGLSVDVMRHLVRPSTERTVIRENVRYEFPWQDKAVGLALFRSQYQTENLVFVKGLHHFCSPDIASCTKYKGFVAFGVPTADLSVLEDTKQKLMACSDQSSRKVQEGFHVKNTPDAETTEWVVSGCESMTNDGTHFAEELKRLRPVVEAELSEDTTCAEKMYLHEHPEVVKLVENGTYTSGREHYIDKGWEDAGVGYFCPDYCVGRKFEECIKDCNREQFYLEQYPDIKAGVAVGRFRRGGGHYRRFGHKEGRVWSCAKASLPDELGTKDGCLEMWKKFIDNTYPVVKTWDLWGEPNDLPAGQEDQCRAVMLIDGRGGPWIEYMLRILRRYLGPDWMFYLLGPSDLARQWRKDMQGPMVEVIEIPNRYNLSDYPTQVNDLYTSKWLWQDTIKCEYIVHTHADVMLLRPGVEDFLHYAYVGAAVSPETYIAKLWSRICTKHFRCGGGGGFSIRRRSHTLRALDECKVDFTEAYAEDIWYSQCLAEMEVDDPLATREMSNRLTLGDKCDVDNPVGIHHVWMFCATSTCAYTMADSVLYRDIYRGHVASKACVEGEYYYYHKYKDVQLPIKEGTAPAWEHYQRIGRLEGRLYPCFDRL